VYMRVERPGGSEPVPTRPSRFAPTPRSPIPVSAPRPQPATLGRLAIQPRLKIGAVDDPAEREADRVAEAVTSPSGDAAGHVSQGTQGAEATIRRQAKSGPAAGEDEIRKQLVRAFLNDQETIQRQPAKRDEETEGERILMQAKPTGHELAPTGGELESRAQSLEGSGRPLPAPIRNEMEPRFGHDFSSVRIHTDGNATELTRLASARALTVGRNVAFAAGEYSPETSAGSRQLLAHELTHVVQQGRAGPSVQRKIVVGGTPYTPTAGYYSYLTANFGPAMKEFVEQMHNGGSPPIYNFSTFEQMGYEVRVRANAIKGIEDVHAGCCSYYGTGDPPHLNPTYWDHIGSGVNFEMKSPLPAGKHPSDAIDSIFTPGAHTRLECLTMTLAIQYRAMLKALGPAKFNTRFAGGIRIAVGGAQPLVTGADRKYEIITVASKAAILPGDWVYFRNFHDYTTRVPAGYWQGENAIVLGGGKYRGFGVASLSEHDMNQELVNQYNTGGAPLLSRTVADLLADGGGLQLSPVARPIISKIAPP